MNKDLAGYTYGAVLNPYRVNYKIGQGSAQIQREAIILGTVDDTMNYGSTQVATDLVLQMPIIRNNGVIITIGALSLQVPDGTALGGNARGAGAVDLQTGRVLATQVASGAYSFAAGRHCTASSGNAIAIGSSCIASNANAIAFGNNNTASQQDAFCVGSYSTADGFTSIASGYGAKVNGIRAKWVHGINTNYSLGGSQLGTMGVTKITTDATPSILLADGTAALSASNQCTLQNNNAIAFNVEIVARDTATGSCARWEAKGLIKRGANASTTALVGVPTITLTHNDAVTWAVVGAIALTADTTNGALAITVTGAVATTIKWLAKIETVEVV